MLPGATEERGGDGQVGKGTRVRKERGCGEEKGKDVWMNGWITE